MMTLEVVEVVIGVHLLTGLGITTSWLEIRCISSTKWERRNFSEVLFMAMVTVIIVVVVVVVAGVVHVHLFALPCASQHKAHHKMQAQAQDRYRKQKTAAAVAATLATKQDSMAHKYTRRHQTTSSHPYYLSNKSTRETNL
jgi:predicted metalloprotease